jgi:hypothetical protein
MGVMDELSRASGPALADGFRIFAAGPGETQVLGSPPGVEEAYDLMTAGRVPPQTAADMAMAAHRAGKDPVAFARHFVSLRKSARGNG